MKIHNPTVVPSQGHGTHWKDYNQLYNNKNTVWPSTEIDCFEKNKNVPKKKIIIQYNITDKTTLPAIKFSTSRGES